jgi:aryl-alcohol dehydrogenase-like predicted oxidoreductase
MKLALGTVQFGLKYGVANTHGRVTEKEAKDLLSLAKRAEIDTLDTAIAYGDSESILGNLGVTDWKVITKLPFMPDVVSDVRAWVFQNVHESLSRLNSKRLYGLMLHSPMQLLEPQGQALFYALETLKAEGLVEKTGVSVYDVAELAQLFEHYSLDLVQAPLNILDRRLMDSGWADRLKSAGVELHVRSAFLQGLLLMPPQDRPKKFSRWSQVWEVWDAWLLESECSPLQASLRYLHGLPAVDRVVVGVDTSVQLQEILSALRGGDLRELPKFDWMGDDRLLNPARWSEL